MRTERVIIELTDDIDGTGNASTVTFALDGKAYEIELNKRNEKQLRKALDPFIENAREVRPQRPVNRSRKKAARKSSPDPSAVREWAAEHGVELNPNGRLPMAVIEQYEEAQKA
jgi:type IV secretory pathway TrbF-like protein